MRYTDLNMGKREHWYQISIQYKQVLMSWGIRICTGKEKVDWWFPMHNQTTTKICHKIYPQNIQPASSLVEESATHLLKQKWKEKWWQLCMQWPWNTLVQWSQLTTTTFTWLTHFNIHQLVIQKPLYECFIEMARNTHLE